MIDPMIIICLLFGVVFSSITSIAETHFQLTLCAASAHIIMLFTNRACWILTWLACQPFLLPCSIFTAGGATGMCVFTQSSARMGILLNGLSNYWITLLCVPVVLQGESLYTNLSRLLHYTLPKKSHCGSSICVRKSIQSPTSMYQPTTSKPRSPRHSATSHRQSTCIRYCSGSSSAYEFLMELIVSIPEQPQSPWTSRSNFSA